MNTYKGESIILGQEEMGEDEADAFNRAKKKVESMHKAKKMERMGKR
jgi:hypothetical protein